MRHPSAALNIRTTSPSSQPIRSAPVLMSLPPPPPFLLPFLLSFSLSLSLSLFLFLPLSLSPHFSLLSLRFFLSLFAPPLSNALDASPRRVAFNCNLPRCSGSVQPKRRPPEFPPIRSTLFLPFSLIPTPIQSFSLSSGAPLRQYPQDHLPLANPTTPPSSSILYFTVHPLQI